MSSLVSFQLLEDQGDQRGSSFSIPLPHLEHFGPVRHLHISTLHPNHIRGNHSHCEQREILIVNSAGDWTFYWDEGASTLPQSRHFPGPGMVLIQVHPASSHAVVNTGTLDLTIVGLSDAPYDPAAPDVVQRIVTPAFP